MANRTLSSVTSGPLTPRKPLQYPPAPPIGSSKRPTPQSLPKTISPPHHSCPFPPSMSSQNSPGQHSSTSPTPSPLAILVPSTRTTRSSLSRASFSWILSNPTSSKTFVVDSEIMACEPALRSEVYFVLSACRNETGSSGTLVGRMNVAEFGTLPICPPQGISQP